MFKKYKMNCLVFALKMWLSKKLRTKLFITRSLGLKGLIPHFGHQIERDGYLFVEDYIPKERKDTITDKGDSFVFFDGVHRVKVYELKAITLGDSLYSARVRAFKEVKE